MKITRKQLRKFILKEIRSSLINESIRSRLELLRDKIKSKKLEKITKKIQGHECMKLHNYLAKWYTYDNPDIDVQLDYIDMLLREIDLYLSGENLEELESRSEGALSVETYCFEILMKFMADDYQREVNYFASGNNAEEGQQAVRYLSAKKKKTNLAASNKEKVISSFITNMLPLLLKLVQTTS